MKDFVTAKERLSNPYKKNLLPTLYWSVFCVGIMTVLIYQLTALGV